MQQKASMVITCYNKQDYIGRMLDSVIAQVYDNIEVIIVNDGSTDGSLEVIDSYVPKLKQRGYDVVVIDQENMGRAPALRSGLQRVTSEYVCFPDGDDTLLNEYVSAPVEYMNEHEDVDFVVSDKVAWAYSPFENPYMKSQSRYRLNDLSSNQILRMMLMHHYVATTPNTIVSRVEYFDRCGIVKNIADERSYTQETQIWLPLLICGGKMHYLKKVTYDYDKNIASSITGVANSNKASSEELKRNNIESSLYILRKYNALTDEFFTMLSLWVLVLLLETSPYHSNQELVKEYLKHIRIDTDEETVYKAGLLVLHYHTANNVCRVDFTSEVMPVDTEEVIAYGAFGKAAKQILTGLLNSDIKPTAFWDTAAKQGNEIAGVPVTAPDFNSLEGKQVTVLMLLKNHTISKEVTESICAANRNTRILYFYDVLDYLTHYYLDGVNVSLRIL